MKETWASRRVESQAPARVSRMRADDGFDEGGAGAGDEHGEEAGVGDALVGAEADGGGADEGEARVELGPLEGVETG